MMQRERRDELNRHLTPDEIERCATGGSPEGRPRRLATHLEGCAACRREVALLEALDRELAALPYLEASAGFASRVMARVRLPVPWHETAWATIRRRWAVLAAGLAAASVSVGGVAWWLFGKQELTPSGLLALVADGVRLLAVRAAIAGGRLLYDLGVVDFARALTEQVALTEAAAGMALLSLLSCGALWTMKRLVQADAPRLSRTARS